MAYREKTTLKDLEDHNLRDANIRRALKGFIDHFRQVERAYLRLGSRSRTGWKQRIDHAIITHQDDMTKVDLPSFIVTASSDIAR